MEERYKKGKRDFGYVNNEIKEESRKIRLAIENMFIDVVKTLGNEYSSLLLSELDIQVNKSRKLLTVFDDSKSFTKDIYLEESLDNIDNIELFYQNAPRLIKEAAINCRNKKVFDQMNFIPPLTLIILDDKEEVMSKFILIDSDRMYAEEKILENFDKELDIFIKNLLSDLE